ncbi:MAG: hypothetical protein SFV22_01075 [Saprospiraceae bacterium]|nr:hypothetical protein [Saprospiraceae bacterium]
MKWYLTILTSLFLIITPVVAQGEYWKPAKTPYGGGDLNVKKMENGPMYAGQYPHSMYRSDDNGQNWTLLPDLAANFPDSISKNIQIGNKESLFLTLNNPLLPPHTYRSTDEGQNWTLIGTVYYNMIETHTGVLLAYNNNDGYLYRSTDGGQTWSFSSNKSGIFGYMPHGELVIANFEFIYRSTDDGFSWSVNPFPVSGSWLDEVFVTPAGTIFVTSSDTIYRSDDGGSTLLPTSLGKTESASYVVLDGGRLLVQRARNFGTYESLELMYSDDEGLTWQVLADTEDGAGGKLITMNPLPDGTILKQHLDALLRSSDGGESWQFSGNGIRATGVDEIRYVSDSTVFANARIGLWKSENDGETWRLITLNEENIRFNDRNFDVLPNGRLTAFQDDRLLYSENLGETFTDITPAVGIYQSVFQYAFLHPDQPVIFTNGANSKVLRSGNNGQTWTTSINNDLVHSMGFLSSGRIIANCVYNVYYSDNGGLSWTTVQNPGWSDSGPITEVAPNGTIYVSREDRSFWRSKDEGVHWTKLPDVLATNFIKGESMVITPAGHLYLCDGYEDIFLSLDEGNTWQNIPTIFESQQLWELALTPDMHLQICNWQSNYPGVFETTQPITEGAYITGTVKLDADSDCSTPDAQAPLQNRAVQAIGNDFVYYTQTDIDGRYNLFVNTGDYQVVVQNPSGIWWDYCEDTVAVSLSMLLETDTADFVAIPLSFCPLMSVNVAIPYLRRCFNNQIFVSYCNQGTEAAPDAWVDVMLDPFLTFINSDQPNADIGNNTYRFFVGDLESGACGQFSLTVYANCDSTVLGQTHCVLAHGFPDTLCTTVPAWSGADLTASVTCLDSTIQFTLRNEGQAASQILDYIIIVDEIVQHSGQESYDAGESLALNFASEGQTWRIESEQEPGHPFSSLVLAFAEGCGGYNSLGYINQFPVNGIQPAWHRSCVENIGAYDPNDKQGFPVGVGDQHGIRPGQALDYLIRFQNTGTDTAFTVVIRDTLSHLLDPLSFQPGASSHPYTWELSGPGVVTFTFDDILLPDSNINEAASHGFVQFNIRQRENLALGDIIENRAAIYFDFNAPVITNQTWHTLAESPLNTSAIKDYDVLPAIQAWPNPFTHCINLQLPLKMQKLARLVLYDALGQVVATKDVTKTDTRFCGHYLPPGLYWAALHDDAGKVIAGGKWIKTAE